MTPDTLLLRQVHPKFIQNEQLSSQAFTPFPRDHGMLSVYDGDQVSPSDAFRHYTELLGNSSVGVWAVTCAEASSVDLPSKPDPLPNFPSHSLIDFSQHPQRNQRRLAKLLRDLAFTRGCLFSK